jgi:hypothetical protein
LRGDQEIAADGGISAGSNGLKVSW